MLDTSVTPELPELEPAPCQPRWRALASFAASAFACLLASGCGLRPAGAIDSAVQRLHYIEDGDGSSPVVVVPTDVPQPYFVLEGEPFCFAGANNYYLMYKSESAVLDVLDAAVDMNARVMRTWAFLDRGSLDGRVANIRDPGHQDGVYFQYWDRATGKPAYNDGPNGLQRLDFVLHQARKRGLKLILTMTNGWRDFGGMDQYLTWYGLDAHHAFYTDQRVRKAYKDWVHHLVTRVNSLDGVPYAEDPAIFAWELANEPRTVISESFDRVQGWDKSTLTRWADEMSTYVRSLDKNHMIAVGDEGFLAGGGKGWAYEAPYGVDTEALTSLRNVDFGTYHLYPDHWGTGHAWGMQWIEEHQEVARRVGKPMLLEEYGLQVERSDDTARAEDTRRRRLAYANWNEVALKRGAPGALFWMLAGMEKTAQGPKLYRDYDHFTVYRKDETFALLSRYAKRFRNEARACELARGAEHGSPSRFVQSRPAPQASLATK